MITVIAPHARPEFTTNLLVNFRRQRGVECRLLVMSNGAASMVPGIVVGAGITILRSEAHQADAMNAGLAWLRGHGGGHWARFDDDDWYGPDYLAEVERSLQGGGLVVSGMPWRYVMLDDGLHLFAGSGEFTGGSLAASSADVAQFPRVANDDLQWCQAMREGGARFVEREPCGYCYDRRSRSAPRVIPGGDIITRRAFGPSLFYGRHPLSAVDDRDLARHSPARYAMPGDSEVFAAMGAM